MSLRQLARGLTGSEMIYRTRAGWLLTEVGSCLRRFIGKGYTMYFLDWAIPWKDAPAKGTLHRLRVHLQWRPNNCRPTMNMSQFTVDTLPMLLGPAAFTAPHFPHQEGSLVSTSKVLSSWTAWKWPTFMARGQGPGLSCDSRALSVSESKLVLLPGPTIKTWRCWDKE